MSDAERSAQGASIARRKRAIVYTFQNAHRIATACALLLSGAGPAAIAGEPSGDLHVLALGDSIVNDTMRSGWVAKLAEAYPKARIRATVYVRGGGGCQHYKEAGRVAKNVVPRKPDLVLIGGISQRDVESIREVVRQLREGLPDVEILL
ncbi:MAG: hypothetical protein ACUVYA_04180, partial [Planctomycetota bacterium]